MEKHAHAESGEDQEVGLGRRLRQASGPAVRRLLFRSGFTTALRRARPSHRLAILRYHAICDGNAQPYAEPAICISPAAFERHVHYLVGRYHVMSLPDAVDCIRAGRVLPQNAVAITFDDGYADNLYAARVLNRYGVTGTFYVTSSCIGGAEPFWPSEIRQLVERIDRPEVTISVDGRAVRLGCATPLQRQESIRTLTRLFKSVRVPTRESYRAQLRERAQNPTLPSVMLTWGELHELMRLGMTIGAHTMTHPNLPSAGTERAREEIEGAKRKIDQELGTETTMFSYPNGGAEVYFTPEIVKCVKNTGFLAASTSMNGFAGTDSDPYALERVQVAERLEDLIFALEVERFAFKPIQKGRT